MNDRGGNDRGGNDRGGQQRIPRPASSRPGRTAPWAALSYEQRRFTLAEVEAACTSLPRARPGVAPPTARPAAVLMALFEEEGEARVILTKRPETMPSHQGEIAFPGGKLEESVDEDLRAAALREAWEEIGLVPALVSLVAELDGMTTVMGRFVLTPFVGLLRGGRPELVPDPLEVDSVFDVALSELLDPEVFREERWDIPAAFGVDAGDDRPIHFFELLGETVWGATARILFGFLEHLTATR
jgi:8-oxo-dGTP pyrophosphatase MutT (NUDIX family)